RIARSRRRQRRKRHFAARSCNPGLSRRTPDYAARDVHASGEHESAPLDPGYGYSKERVMSEPIWNQFLTERDKAVFAASGYGARGKFGNRPALLIIDVNWAFCGDKPEPILESIKCWRNSCGEDAWTALPYIRSLIDKCHEKCVPVIYTTGVRRDDNWDSGSWLWKNARGNEDRRMPASNLDGNEIVTPIAPGPRDIVVYKQKPSGF